VAGFDLDFAATSELLLIKDVLTSGFERGLEVTGMLDLVVLLVRVLPAERGFSCVGIFLRFV